MLRAVSLFLALAALVFAPAAALDTFIEVVPNGAQWSPRSKANVEFIAGSRSFRYYDDQTQRTSTITLNNYFLLYGGEAYSGEGMNDVWVGNSAGNRWYFVAGVNENGVAHPLVGNTFYPCVENAHIMDGNNKQYRAGGRGGGEPIRNDVWTSVDGVNWVVATSNAEWEPRFFASLTTDSRNYVYLAGGILQEVGPARLDSNEVWRSVDGGRSWIEVNPLADANVPGARGVAIMLSSGSVWGTEPVLMWLTGVNTNTVADDQSAYYSDVWATRDSGRSWSAVTLSATFGRRNDANAEITANGLIVLAGGYAGTATREIYNDVWVSANGGYSWGSCVNEAEWDDRRYLMTVLDNNGILWIMGGQKSGYVYSDIWKSTWSFSDNTATAQRCKVAIPSCGVGLRCWPGDAATLVATDGANVYCASCPYDFGNSTTATLVVVFLVVFLIGFLITAALLGYTYYKLRSAGAPSPIPLPASAQAWWNKSTASSVSGSTDAGVTGGADQLYQPLRIRDQV